MLRVAVAAALSVAGIGVGTNIAAGEGSGDPNAAPEAATSATSGGTCDYAIPLANGMTHCVSLDGNVVSINVEGNEHIFHGAISEGYEVCQSGSLLGYDSGDWGESGFTDVSTVLSGKTVTVVRNTGPIQLTQVITSVPADHEVKVKVTLKNLTASPLSDVTYARFVDADVDYNLTGSYLNDFLTTRRTAEAFRAFGADAGTLKLANQSKAAAVSASVDTSIGSYSSCADGTTVGTMTAADGVMKVLWNVPKIQPGKTQVSTFTYTAN